MTSGLESDHARPGRLQEAPRAARVQVVAHRGASEDAPEHTLAAYRTAIDDGADALECDVRLTRDGHLVCVHDRRVDRTSTGRGPVSTLELAELAELDWGSWYDRSGDHRTGAATAEQPDHDRSAVLTLERLLEVVADAGRPVEVAVETKHPTRYAGLVERRLVELLGRFGWTSPRVDAASPVRVMSFSPLSLRRIAHLAPGLPTVLLLQRLPLRLRDGGVPGPARIVGPAIELVRSDPGYVARVHRRGGAVHVWTVDRSEDVDLCLRLGVDAIITNRPRSVLTLVGR